MGISGRALWRDWWWVCVFSLLAVSIFSHCIEEKTAQVRELSVRFEEMLKEKHQAMEERQDLQLQIASQNDPNWIEMILMRDLGVVPEGWLKVHFIR